MRFENENPMQNSALLISNTEESDEGTYTCRISTFPYGNFDRDIKFAVWGKSPSHFSSVALFKPSQVLQIGWIGVNTVVTSQYWFKAGDVKLYEPDSDYMGVVKANQFS